MVLAASAMSAVRSTNATAPALELERSCEIEAPESAGLFWSTRKQVLSSSSDTGLLIHAKES